MPASAPRYDERVLAAARRLDDECQPIAEICRRVGAEMERLGLPRPSYVHLRRYVAAERERRRALRELRADVLTELAAGLTPKLDRVLSRRREANLRAELRRRS